jgi:DNA polymerase-3 subunit alpha
VVIRYIADKYGSEHVAQVITFGSMGPRLAVRDAGRAMNTPIPEVDRIAKQIDATRSIRDSVDSNPDLRREYEENETVRRLVDTAEGIEGLARHGGTHPAAVVISKEPLRNVVPLQRSTEGDGLTTQFDWVSIDSIGLLKMDVLGLRTLTVMKNALQLVEHSRGESIDLDAIPFDDQATFEQLGTGETTGVFQLESSGMRQVVTELKPDHLADIVALVALYRPGPMAKIPDYIAGKHGSREISYPDPKLEPILQDCRPLHGLRGESPLRHAQEEARRHGPAPRRVRGRRREERSSGQNRRGDLVPDGRVRRLWLQQGALGQLRDQRLSDGLP